MAKDNGDTDLTALNPVWQSFDKDGDIRYLFLQLDHLFFRGTMTCLVEVKWSKKMTLIAGNCKFNEKEGSCTITLSEPLLRSGSTKALLETLVHEMIHAYQFVTNQREREHHGQIFQRHMDRISKESGLNLTIYHGHDLSVFRNHWWRCDGPCQYEEPRFGYVKRAMDRAPSAKEKWFLRHQAECGGDFSKVKEPKDSTKKRARPQSSDGRPAKRPRK